MVKTRRGVKPGAERAYLSMFSLLGQARAGAQKCLRQPRGKMPQEKPVQDPCQASDMAEFLAKTRRYRRRKANATKRHVHSIAGPRVGSQWLVVVAGRRFGDGGTGRGKSRGEEQQTYPT